MTIFKSPQWRNRTIQLPSAVIGQDNTIDAALARHAGLFAMQDTLDHKAALHNLRMSSTCSQLMFSRLENSALMLRASTEAPRVA